MKLSEIYQRRDRYKQLLNEIPYLHPGELPNFELDGTVSASYLKREYNQLGVTDGIRVMLHRDKVTTVGVYDDGEDNDGRFVQLFRIIFKRKHELNFKHPFTNILQEDRIKAIKEIAGQGVMSKVYKLIVSRGYTLVSDNAHFDPAQGLWTKMAKDPSNFIWVADVDNGLFSDNQGKPLRYVGQKGLIDADAWTTGSDYNGTYRLIILTNRDIR